MKASQPGSRSNPRAICRTCKLRRKTASGRSCWLQTGRCPERSWSTTLVRIAPPSTAAAPRCKGSPVALEFLEPSLAVPLHSSVSKGQFSVDAFFASEAQQPVESFGHRTSPLLVKHSRPMRRRNVAFLRQKISGGSAFRSTGAGLPCAGSPTALAAGQPQFRMIVQDLRQTIERNAAVEMMDAYTGGNPA